MKQEHQQFVSFLEGTLIPDLKESGTEATAEDFEKAVRFIKELAAKLDLVTEVYSKFHAGTESFEDDNIGPHLSYLMGAILKDGVTELIEDGETDSVFVETLRTLFPGAAHHPVWRYVKWG